MPTQSRFLNEPHPGNVAPLAPGNWPTIDTPSRPVDAADDQLASDKPPLGRRMFRAVARFVILVLIGVVGTLEWQSHGDEAMALARSWAPSLDRFLAVSAAKPAPDAPVIAPAAAPSQPLAATASAVPAATSPSAGSVRQLQPTADDLALIRQSVEQLAAKQQQIAQSIASLQAGEQEIRQKMSSLPSSQPVPLPPRKPSKRTTSASVVPASGAPPLRPSTQPSAGQLPPVPPAAPSAEPPLPLR